MADENPLKWWEQGGTRRTVAFSFCAALLLGILALVPDIDHLYTAYPAIKDIIESAIGILGLSLAFLELTHSDEANQHRAERNRLGQQANSLSIENNELHQQTLDLQREVHELQREIERKLTKVRLYARARSTGAAIQLFVSNLSDFDLWINQVRLIVTDGASVGLHIIGGANRLSSGHTEEAYSLYGNLLSVNQNRADIDMKFYVQIEAAGIADDPVTINSPQYHFILSNRGIRKFETIR
jgi:hypothetical protein